MPLEKLVGEFHEHSDIHSAVQDDKCPLNRLCDFGIKFPQQPGIPFAAAVPMAVSAKNELRKQRVECCADGDDLGSRSPCLKVVKFIRNGVAKPGHGFRAERRRSGRQYMPASLLEGRSCISPRPDQYSFAQHTDQRGMTCFTILFRKP